VLLEQLGTPLVAEGTGSYRTSLRDPKAPEQVGRAGRGWGGPLAPALRICAGGQPESVLKWHRPLTSKGVQMGGMGM
jgi:hypothetical protein